MTGEYLPSKKACEYAGVTYPTLKRCSGKKAFASAVPKGFPVAVQRGEGRTCEYWWHKAFVEAVKSRYAIGSLQPT